MKLQVACLLLLLGALAAKRVTLLVIDEVDSGRTTPPYDFTVEVDNLPDSATLLDVMDSAVVQDPAFS